MTENLTFAYYPGCSATSTNRAYDVSTRNVAKVLGIGLEELNDWNCCGASAYLSVDEKKAMVFCARNLALAEKEGKDIVAICSGCYVVLRKANQHLAEDPNLAAEINKSLAAGGMSYQNSIKVRHFLDITVHEAGQDAVRDRVTHPLTGLKVAPYYGCMISRPFNEVDDEESPRMMDDLIEWLGATAVLFPLKSKCCGGLMMTTQPPVGQQLTGYILRSAKEAGADCIITACPLCQLNLEAYQDTIGKTLDMDCRIPVLYFTQLMGVAFGLDKSDLALKECITPVETVLSSRGT
ncbi:MAG: disulfide reductase [Phycisphaerae bacterium]|nr:disulfide reductase [Phycisphaerae bacterium]